MGVNIKQVMFSLASSCKVIFVAERIANDKEIQLFPMILKWVLNYHQFWTHYPNMCFLHIHMVVFCLLLKVQINQAATQDSESPQANTDIVCSGSKRLTLNVSWLGQE